MSVTDNSDYQKTFAIFGVRKHPQSPYGVHYDDVRFVEDYLDYLWGWHQGDLKIISGGSHGVEMITEEWALRKHVAFERVKPILNAGHIDPFGIRNEKIIDRCTEVVIFWDAHDTQLGSTLRTAVQRGKRVTIVPVIYPSE